MPTRWAPLVKAPAAGLLPNLVDYASARATFTWSRARAALDGLPGGAGLNIAHEAVDRHAAGPRGDPSRFDACRRTAAAAI